MMADKKLSWDSFKQGIALIYAAFVDLRAPGDDILRTWYGLMGGFENDIYKEACIRVSLKTRRPSNVIGEIRQSAIDFFMEKSGILSAEATYQQIQDLIDRFYSPEFNSTTWKLILDRAPKHLTEVIKKWGPEIAAGSNPTATRAQFRDYYNQLICSKQFQHIAIEAAKDRGKIESESKTKLLLPQTENEEEIKRRQLEEREFCEKYNLKTRDDHIEFLKSRGYLKTEND